jgi:hypothetical protein
VPRGEVARLECESCAWSASCAPGGEGDEERGVGQLSELGEDE